MRVAIEALGAEFGGVRIYLENLLKAWAVQYPDDELLVVVRGDSDLDTGRHHRQEMAVPAPDPVFRPLVQTRQLPRLIREFDAEVSLSTIPVTGLMRTDHPQAVVIHDLRHEIRREEFTRARRVLRAVAYTRAYTVADGFVAVSRRSLDDLHRLHPRTVRKPAAVVHHGADHVVAWGEPTRDGPAIAFGHHTNKRPDLVIRAWAKTSRAGPELPPLRVLGVSAQLRPTLEGLVDVLNLRDRVELSGYVPSDQLRAAMLAARLIVLPSTFEGFGLPIVEAMALRTPVVIGPDPGAEEAAGGHATVMTDWTADALADAVTRGLSMGQDRIGAAGTYADTLTWARTVRGTRTFLSGLVKA